MNEELKNMNEKLASVLKEIRALGKGLENNVSILALQLNELSTPCCDEYADAVLLKNGHGGDTAEIYFYRFAPKRFPRPSDREEFEALMRDPERNRIYERTCYQGWIKEIQAVQKIIAEHGGLIEVEGMPFKDYLSAVEKSGEIPNHRVHIKVSVPGQYELRALKEMEDLLNREMGCAAKNN